MVVVFRLQAKRRRVGMSRGTPRLSKLPTPVLTGSGSKGLSQPGVAGHPRFKNAY